MVCQICFEVNASQARAPGKVKKHKVEKLNQLAWAPLTLFVGILLFALLWVLTASNYWAFLFTQLASDYLLVIWSLGFFVHFVLFGLQQLKRIRLDGYNPERDERTVAAILPTALLCLLALRQK
jgi:hypothetical protein